MIKFIHRKGSASTVHIQSIQYIRVLKNKNTRNKNYKKMKMINA